MVHARSSREAKQRTREDEDMSDRFSRICRRSFSLILFSGALVGCSGNESSGQSASEKPHFVQIFDGESFEGWEGDPEWFRIEANAIVGGSLEQEIPHNMFLATTEEYSDFELHLKVKLRGDREQANAGIQIRSRRIPDHHEMIGYQADMGQQYWGCLYDESRRGKILAEPDREALAQVLEPSEWNEYVIRCRGKRIQLWINGFQTVDYTESDPDIEQTGLIGLQIHRGPPMEASYKDIKLKVLSLRSAGN
jgi:hypothetical protein